MKSEFVFNIDFNSGKITDQWVDEVVSTWARLQYLVAHPPKLSTTTNPNITNEHTKVA